MRKNKINLELLKVAAERLGDVAKLKLGNIIKTDYPDNYFDCVICSEVIEHIPNDPRWCTELIRCLKPGGLLILGTPDYGGWSWPTIEWIYGKVMPGSYADEHITHYTRQSLIDQMATYGFKPLETGWILGGEMIITFRQI